MYTVLNSSNSAINHTVKDSDRIIFTYSSSSTSPSTSFDNLSSILLILILSVLCCFGVIFMIFGPMMRSEAWKRVDNYIFGQDEDQGNREDGGADNCDA